jgi:hypothetical protein
MLWRDDAWRFYTLREVEPGDNEVMVSIQADNDLEIPAPFLVGNFSMGWLGGITTAGPLLLATGSWHEQGLPAYCGAVDYQQHVAIPDDWREARIFLQCAEMRDTVQLSVNGKNVMTRGATPYHFDVTHVIEAGTNNDITLRIWNTASSVMEETPAPSGILGPVRLVAYPRVELKVEL